MLFLFFTAYVFTSFFKISANVIMPIYKERFQISSSLAGFISGTYYLSYAVMQLFASPLSRKYGALRVVGCGFLIACLGSLCFAFATNSMTVLLGRFFVGIGVGPVFISILSFLTDNYEGRQYSIYTGLAVTFSGLGQVIASAPLKILVDRFSIRQVFSVISVLLCLISFILLKTSSYAKRKQIERTSILKQISNAASITVKKPVLLFICIIWILYNSFQHSYQGLWSSSWSLSSYPELPQLSGLSATFVSLGLMCGTFFSERLKKKETKRLISTVRSEYEFLLATFLVCLTHKLPISVCLIADFILGYTIGDICIQQNAYTREITDDSVSASIIGFMNFSSSLGSIFFQWMTGLSFDFFNRTNNQASSYLITFLLFSVLVLIFTVIGTILQIHSEKNN